MISFRPALHFAKCASIVLAICQTAFAAEAEKHSLQAQRLSGDLTHVEVTVQVGGDLKLVTDGKHRKLPMSVVASLTYDEQILAAGDDAIPTRSVRYYENAVAVIKVDKGGEKPTLDPRRRLIVVEKPDKSSPILVCPTSPLSREELDLVEVPGNTLLVDRFLPAEPVAVGDSWQLDKQSLADLLGIDGVSTSDVKASLAEISDSLADIAATGSVVGAVGGVSTEIDLKARCKFDLEQKRIVYFALLIKEKRAVGHVGPGLDTVAKVLVKIRPISGSENLTADAVASLPSALAPEAMCLRYTAAGGQFGFLHDRRWFLTTEDPKLAVFRLVDRGELIAQCNVSAVAAGQKKGLSLAEFQRDVQQSLGKNFGQFVSAGQSTSDAGYTVLRVVVQGTVSKLPIEWIYYLVSDAQGQRVSLAFTLEENLKERFAEADRGLAGGIRISQAQASTAAKPALTAAKPAATNAKPAATNAKPAVSNAKPAVTK